MQNLWHWQETLRALPFAILVLHPPFAENFSLYWRIADWIFENPEFAVDRIGFLCYTPFTVGM